MISIQLNNSPAMDYLMLQKVYEKKDIIANGWSVVLSPKFGKYIAELNRNVYVLEPYGNDRIPTHFNVVEATISNHEIDKWVL